MAALRSLTRSVPPTKAGPFIRLVGSLDFKGQGTKHELESLDPYVLCDDGGTHVGKGLPPFGIHPHSGLIAVSFVLEGAFSDMDNLSGPSSELNEAGDIYAVSSGRGVAHMEKTASDGGNRLIQTIVKIPDDKVGLEPEVVKGKESSFPVLDLDGGKVRIGIGKLGGLESPVKLKAMPEMVIGRILVDPGQKVDVPIDQVYEHGFLYVIDGEGIVHENESQSVINSGTGANVFGKGEKLTIENKESSKGLDIFLAAGKPLNEPWKKLLGYNGFIIAKDETEATGVMDKIKEVGVENFSYKVL